MILTSFLKRKKQKGVSLIELLVAISLVTILATTGTISYIKLQQRIAINNDAGLIVVETRNALAMARSNQDGSTWGMKFVKSEDGDYYQILENSEENVYKTVYLDSQVSFGNLYDPDNPDIPTDIVLEMFTGGSTMYPIQSSAIVELIVEGADNLKDTITIENTGLVSRESSYKQGKDDSESACGPGDKILLCHSSSQGWQEITVDNESVDSHLDHGDYCGSCN